MSSNFILLTVLCVVRGDIVRAGSAIELPKLSVRQLKALVKGYHVNRELFVNYGQTIGQLQNAVGELLSKSGELQQSAIEAYELAQAKSGLGRTSQITPEEQSRLDGQQERLVANLTAMADSLNPKLQQVIAGLQSIVASRALLFKENAGRNEAYRRLSHLLNYQYYVHNKSFGAASQKRLRRLIGTFAVHRTEVFLGEPGNDLTSSALYDPNNTVFSRHPENLRHNAFARVKEHHFGNVQAVGQEKVSADAQRLKSDLVSFAAELMQFVSNKGAAILSTSINTVNNDPVTKELMGMAQNLESAAKNNAETVGRLVNQEGGSEDKGDNDQNEESVVSGLA